MTLTRLWEKLRKKNKKDYRQFQFCITFASALIASYLMLMFSPLIQGAMPAGGDSGKMIMLILGIAVVGCMVFVWYAAMLFLRHKSREIGIFMALGAEKGFLRKALSAEMAKLTALYAAKGMAAGAAVSLLVGKALELITRKYQEYSFAFTANGILFSLVFCAGLFMLVLVLALRAMKRTNVMDVINEQRKQEPLRRNVTKGYLISGISFMVMGIFAAYGLNVIMVRRFGIFLGTWVNAFYLIAAIGIYQILVYMVSSRQKGRNPQRYYDNILYYGMIRFQGASVVKNMMVAAFLLLGGLYSLCYLPLMSFASISVSYEDEFSFRYLNDAKELTKAELEEMAAEAGTAIENYREGRFIRVTGSGVERDADNDGNFIEDYYEEFAEYDCTSASQYEHMTGIHLNIPEGGYYLIQAANTAENTWYKFDDMDQLYAKAEDAYLPMKYLGNTEYSALIITPHGGLSSGSRFVVSDRDYERLKDGLTEDKLETQALFDTEDGGGEIKFAREVFREFVLRMSDSMNLLSNYDALAEQQDRSLTGEEKKAVADPENPLAERDWQYDPLLVPLKRQQDVVGSAIRYLLFIYVAVICLAAAGVIGYTRSQSVGLANALLFEDLERLGADQVYRRWLMRQQIKKIYVVPTILGVAIMMGYALMILYMNDGVFQIYELYTALIVAVLSGIVIIYQYIMYRMSAKCVEEMLQLGRTSRKDVNELTYPV